MSNIKVDSHFNAASKSSYILACGCQIQTLMTQFFVEKVNYIKSKL